MQLLHEHAAIALFFTSPEIPEIAGGPAMPKAMAETLKLMESICRQLPRKAFWRRRHGPGEHGIIEAAVSRQQPREVKGSSSIKKGKSRRATVIR